MSDKLRLVMVQACHSGSGLAGRGGTGMLSSLAKPAMPISGLQCQAPVLPEHQAEPQPLLRSEAAFLCIGAAFCEFCLGDDLADEGRWSAEGVTRAPWG